MWESVREVVKGPGAWLVFWVGVFSTVAWVAEQTSGRGSFWQWFSLFALALTGLMFVRFHQLRQRAARDDKAGPVYIDARQFHGGTHSHIRGTRSAPGETPPVDLWTPPNPEAD